MAERGETADRGVHKSSSPDAYVGVTVEVNARLPIIYFLGIAPGRYQAMFPAFISEWDATGARWRMSRRAINRSKSS
jgi:hypothetical protein